MAKIKGIEIKNLKKFVGVEWPENYQGSIYLDGKKIGFWSQDSWGGPDNFDFDNSEVRQLFLSRVKEYFDEHPNEDWYELTLDDIKAGKKPNYRKYSDMFEPDGIFMETLLNLALDEKTFKQKQKKGYGTLVIYNYHHINGPVPVGSYVSYPPRYTMEQIKQDIEKKRSEYPNLDEKIYSSLEDFKIS